MYLINLDPHRLHYYAFMVSLDRCDGSWNALDDLSSRICVPNKTGEVNLSIFSIMTGIGKL